MKRYVTENKPGALLFWGSVGPPEITTVDVLKDKLFAHQDQCTKIQWLQKDTANTLHDARLTDAERMGISTSFIGFPDKKTANAYHSALICEPKIVQRAGVYKPEH